MLGVVIKKVDPCKGKIYVEDVEGIFSEDTEQSYEIALSSSQLNSLQQLFGTDSLIGKKAFLDRYSQTLHFDFVFKGNLKCTQHPKSSYR